MPGKGQYKRTKEEYLELLRAKHGDRFAIDDFEYTGSASPIVAHCREHGPFSIQLLDLITSNRGCKSCPAAEPAQKYKRTREDYVRQIEAKYDGQLLILGDDSDKSEYEGGKTVVTVKCVDHGLFDGRLGKLLDGGKKCPGCHNTVRGRYKRTKQECLDLIHEKYGDKFVIDDFDYEGCETTVIVHCPSHGEFTTKISKLLRDKHGCPKCSREASAAIRTATKTGVPLKARWIPIEEAVDRLDLPEHITADFSQYQSWCHGAIVTLCAYHGETTWPSADGLSKSGNYCSQCGYEKRIRAKTTTWSEFVERSRKKFSGRFDYKDDYGYVNLRSHVSVVCSEHGSQKIRAGKHVINGQYCSQCRKADGLRAGLFPGFYAEQLPFDPELAAQPGRLYYFQHGTKFKIGITKLPMGKRLKGTPDRAKIARVESVEMTMGEALVFEQYALRRFAEHRITRVWTTELFDRDVLLSAGFESLEGYVAWARRSLDYEDEMQTLREACGRER